MRETDVPRVTLLEAILDSFDTPVLVADTEHTIVYMNQPAVEHFSSGRELLGQSLLDCHNERSRGVIRSVLEALQGGETERLISESETQRIYMRAVRAGDGRLLAYYERYEPI